MGPEAGTARLLVRTTKLVGSWVHGLRPNRCTRSCVFSRAGERALWRLEATFAGRGCSRNPLEVVAVPGAKESRCGQEAPEAPKARDRHRMRPRHGTGRSGGDRRTLQGRRADAPERLVDRPRRRHRPRRRGHAARHESAGDRELGSLVLELVRRDSLVLSRAKRTPHGAVPPQQRRDTAATRGDARQDHDASGGPAPSGISHLPRRQAPPRTPQRLATSRRVRPVAHRQQQLQQPVSQPGWHRPEVLRLHDDRLGHLDPQLPGRCRDPRRRPALVPLVELQGASQRVRAGEQVRQPDGPPIGVPGRDRPFGQAVLHPEHERHRDDHGTRASRHVAHPGQCR